MAPTTHKVRVKAPSQTLNALLENYGELAPVSPYRIANDLGIEYLAAWRRKQAALVVDRLLKYSQGLDQSPTVCGARAQLKIIRKVAPLLLLSRRIENPREQWEAFVIACEDGRLPGGREITAAIAAVTGKRWEEVAAPADRNRLSAARLLRGLINHLTEKGTISPRSLRNCVWQLHEIGRLLHLRLEDER